MKYHQRPVPLLKKKKNFVFTTKFFFFISAQVLLSIDKLFLKHKNLVSFTNCVQFEFLILVLRIVDSRGHLTVWTW